MSAEGIAPPECSAARQKFYRRSAARQNSIVHARSLALARACGQIPDGNQPPSRGAAENADDEGIGG
jgi:hypothetical protein